MGSHVGGHTHGYTRRTVKQKQRGLGGKHRGLFERIVEVEGHIDGVLVYVCKHFLGELLELRLRISHRGDGIAVHRTEVTLAENEGISLVPVLGESSHGVIHAGVAVGMELTENLSHYTGAFLGLSGIAEVQLIHTVENSSLHRLETVPGIGKGAGHDYRHRVVDVCGAHLVVYLHPLDNALRLILELFGFIFLNIHFLLF